MSPAPWATHFGLARTPFGKSIPAKDLFGRPAHAEAIARISFCVVESALGVVTGDVGAGKTVALRAAVAALDPTRHQVIYIANPAFGARGLYVTIVRALGDRPRYLKAELMAQASDLLAAEAAERHRRVVIICDEAHLLDPGQLEELRLLTNSEMDSASPFAAILAGQPTLNRQLRLGMFAALVILSFRVSQGRDLRRLDVDSVADGRSRPDRGCFTPLDRYLIGSRRIAGRRVRGRAGGGAGRSRRRAACCGRGRRRAWRAATHRWPSGRRGCRRRSRRHLPVAGACGSGC